MIKRVLMLVCVLGYAVVTQAQPTCQTGQSTPAVGQSSIGTFYTTGAGSDLVAVIGVGWVGSAISINTIAYGAQTPTLVDTQVIGGNNDLFMSMYLLPAPASDSQLVEVTFSGSFSKAVLGVTTCSGVHQTVSIGTPAKAWNTQASSPSVIVNSAAEELAIDVMMSAGGLAPLTAGGGQTERWKSFTTAGGYDMGLASSTKAGSTSVTMAWTETNDDHWGIVAVSLKPALLARRPIRPMVFP